MGYVIAVCGKGGTGKTTTAALLVRLLKEKTQKSILAVDADPNSNLAEVLGLKIEHSIGSILDGISGDPGAIPAGMPKDRFIEYEIQKAITEASGFDLLTMGKPEGPGCYCYVNNCLRNAMAKLIDDYDYIIIDNEAGLEHLSRRTTRSADCLLVVSDATYVGLRAARRISDLVEELKIKTKKKILLINRSTQGVLDEKIKETGLDYLGSVPQDDQLAELSLKGSSLFDLKNDAASYLSLSKIGEKIWQGN
ncbi:MAG: AAA family ATPase [Candidatus Omnitrophica bacterium]|nr:AAA family ATPase [Candidatus Omnitrophota bacterium]